MKYRLIFFVALAALVAGCAKQGYPSGGPRDTKAPECKATKPQNETRNFKAREFYIEFDEYVVIKDANSNVLISPPMQQKPEFTTKGKGVLVRLRDTLQPNATYLFQFKDAIADFTEGNVLPTFEYVFSTGDAMDTMMLGGTVLSARDGKPWKEPLTVMAYADSLCADDTVATHQQPNYITRTDKEGHFAFHYIPAGRYRIVALEDKNRDLRVGNAEAAAWLAEPQAATDSIDSTRLTQLRISAPDVKVQRVVKAEFTLPGRITINTLVPMKTPVLEGEPMEWRLNAGRDTMQVWCTNEKCDSVVLVLSDEGLQDTLKLRYRRPRRGRPGQSQPQAPPLMKPLCSGNMAFYDDLRIAFTVPIKAMRDNATAELMMLKDSTVSTCPISLDSGGMQARLNTTLRSGEQYRVRLSDSLFTDVYGHSSDSLSFTLSPKDYGILNIIVANAAGSPLVVEVLDSRDTVVQSQPLPSAGGTLRFIHLPEGEYRLRAVIDADGNGRWTPGDYRHRRDPETSVMYEKTLKLREKWEMEERWTIKPDTAN